MAGLALDVTVASAFVWLHTFDHTSALWAVLFIPPVEGAILFNLPGALAVWAAATIGYLGRELWGSGVYDYSYSANSIAFRMGVGFFIALVAGLMARDLLRERARARDGLSKLQLLEAVAVATGQAASVEAALQAAVDLVCRHVGWPVGHACVRNGSGELVSAPVWWPEDPERFETFKNVTAARFHRPGVGLVGRVLSSGTPAWTADLTTDPILARAAAADGSEIRVAFAFPVLCDTEVVAVLEFFSPDAGEPDSELLEVVGYLGTQLSRAIERVQAQERLRDSERRLAQAQHLAKIGSWHWDVVADAASWSAELYRIFGVNPDEFDASYAGLLSLSHPDDRAMVGQMVQQAYETGKPVEVEHRIVRADGEVRVVQSCTEVLVGAGARPVRVQGTSQDVTERKHVEAALQRYAEDLEAANRELQAANELKDHFVAVTNHELRTPLTTILGFASTLEEWWTSIPDEKRRDFVARISQQSRRLSRLVEEFLTLAAARAGALQLDLRPVQVEAVLQEALAHNGLAQAEAALSCPPDLQVVADADRLSQILVNYLSNALKYGAAPIAVEAREAGRCVEMRVTDRGHGVPEEFVPRLFERFTQASRGTSRQTRGTGLGLAIVRELAEAQGGEAWYEPNQPHGSCFMLRLPKAGEGSAEGERC